MDKEIKELKLSGISVQLPPEISADGECCDMVNVRNKEGIWQVTGRPYRLISSGGDGNKAMYIHANMDYRHIISYNGEAVFWEADDDNGTITAVTQKIADIKDLLSLESVGNVLIAVTKQGCRYMMFSESVYINLGGLVMPELSFCLENVSSLTIAPTSTILPEYIHENQTSLQSSIISFISEDFSSIYSRGLDKTKEENLFIYPFLVRYAVRLYDGSYIQPSPPVLMSPYDDVLSGRKLELEVGSNPDNGLSYISPHDKIFRQYRLRFSTGTLSDGKWEEIIDCIDIFISEQIPVMKDKIIEDYYLEPGNDGNRFFSKDLTLVLPFISKEDMKEKIIAESLFYKAASIPFKELINIPETNMRDVEMSARLTSLKQNEILKIDNFTHSDTGADTSYIYNSRLHLGGIRQFFPKPFSTLIFSMKQENYNGADSVNRMITGSKCHVKVLLRCTDGEKYVSAPCSVLENGFISPLLSYPDRRATEMEINISTPSNIMCSIKLPLTSSPVENCAYYINTDLTPIKYANVKPGIASDESTFQEEYYPNRMKVSEVNNPFFLPQEFTYPVSMGKILKIAAATAELSQGQYGEFPLYVFTSEGIWAMQQGDGNILYASQHPVNRDVALSQKVISGVDNAVVYVSEHGLTVLQGAQTEIVSNAFDGEAESFEQITMENDNGRIVSESCEIKGFKEHIKNSEIGYDYIHNELLFIRTGKEYYYAFNFNGSGWARRQFGNIPLSGFINSYPELWAADTAGNLYNLSEEESNSDTPFIITTRCIKWIDMCLKQMKELLIKLTADSIDTTMSISVSASDYPTGCFTTLASASVSAGRSDSIRVPMHTRPYRYFRLSISGEGGKKLNFSRIIMTFVPKYTGRVR